MALVPTLGVLALLSTGCSFLTTDRAKCDTSQDCRDEFGVGFSCGSAGFCETSSVPARCSSREPFPADLFTNPQSESNADRIVFGSLQDRSVGSKEARENSAFLAASLANTGGGLEDGREFGIVFCDIAPNAGDDLSLEDAAVQMATYLADEVGVPAIFGPSGSGTVRTVFNDVVVAGNRDVLFISPSATAVFLTTIEPTGPGEEPGLLWRTAPPDDLQATVIAEDMRLGDDGALGAGRTEAVDNVAIIIDARPGREAYGDGLRDGFRQQFLAFGGNPPVEERYTDDAGRVSAITDVGLTPGVEEVLFLSSDANEIITFLDAIAGDLNYTDIEIFLPDSGANSDVISSILPATANKIRGTRPAPLNAASNVFSFFGNAYRAAFGGTSPEAFSFTAHSYDAMWLLVYGSIWAAGVEGAVTGRNIAAGLREISDGDVVELSSSSFNLARQRLGSGMPVNVQGASGALDYNPATEETVGPIQTWRINGMMIEGIETFDP